LGEGEGNVFVLKNWASILVNLCDKNAGLNVPFPCTYSDWFYICLNGIDLSNLERERGNFG
jgi:hypothetical protein